MNIPPWKYHINYAYQLDKEDPLNQTYESSIAAVNFRISLFEKRHPEFIGVFTASEYDIPTATVDRNAIINNDKPKKIRQKQKRVMSRIFIKYNNICTGIYNVYIYS